MDKFEVDNTISTEKEVHYIPVQIEANQKADVDTKFINRVSKDADGGERTEKNLLPNKGDGIIKCRPYFPFVVIFHGSVLSVHF